MATMNDGPEISINGEPYDTGQFNEWSEGGLISWDGEIRGYRQVGERVVVFIDTGSWVRAGNALITSCQSGFDGAVTRFVGDGELLMWHRAALDELRAKWDAERRG